MCLVISIGDVMTLNFVKELLSKLRWLICNKRESNALLLRKIRHSR